MPQRIKDTSAADIKTEPWIMACSALLSRAIKAGSSRSVRLGFT